MSQSGHLEIHAIEPERIGKIGSDIMGVFDDHKATTFEALATLSEVYDHISKKAGVSVSHKSILGEN